MTRAGYPNRSAHGDFHARYRALAPGAPGAAALAAAVAEGRHAFGRTRVYLRAGCLEDLERRLRAARGAAATAVAAALRGRAARAAFLRLRRAAAAAARRRRGAAARAAFLRAKGLARAGQGLARRRAARLVAAARRLVRAATAAAAARRGAVARARFARRRGAAVAIQCAARRRGARGAVAALAAEAEERARLEHQLEALRARLDAEAAARADAEAAAAELRSAMASPERRAAAPRAEEARVDGALVDESKRMLDYLRSEVSRLARANDGLERENHRLRVANDRVQQAHGAAHESFAALNSHIKRLGRTVLALKRDARDLRQANGVFKDELAMKQAIYVAEVAKGLRLEQLMRTMVDVCDVRGADPELVAELRAMADARALHDGGVRDAEVAAGGEEAAQPGFWGRLIGRGS